MQALVHPIRAQENVDADSDADTDRDAEAETDTEAEVTRATNYFAPTPDAA